MKLKNICYNIDLCLIYTFIIGSHIILYLLSQNDTSYNNNPSHYMYTLQFN